MYLDKTEKLQFGQSVRILILIAEIVKWVRFTRIRIRSEPRKNLDPDSTVKKNHILFRIRYKKQQLFEINFIKSFIL